jgi:hypothetical protein
MIFSIRRFLVGRGWSRDASEGIEIEDWTASLYAALWDEAQSFSGPR